MDDTLKSCLMSVFACLCQYTELIYLRMTLNNLLATAAPAMAPRMTMRKTLLVFLPLVPLRKGCNAAIPDILCSQWRALHAVNCRELL